MDATKKVKKVVTRESLSLDRNRLNGDPIILFAAPYRDATGCAHTPMFDKLTCPRYSPGNAFERMSPCPVLLEKPRYQSSCSDSMPKPRHDLTCCSIKTTRDA
jgi:hypothetical protein